MAKTLIGNVKGPKGADGKNGSNGVTPHIGSNGNWYIGTTDTGIPATGPAGSDGQDGQNGSPGKDGAAGQPGEDGQRGTGILNTTSGVSAYTTAVGGVTPAYRILLSALKTQSKVDEVLVGDTVRYSYYVYPVIYVDSEYAYLGTRVSIRGATGAKPVKGTDYWTDADKTEMVDELTEQAAPVSYKGQTLTDAQKAQARENIGALANNQGTANVGKILVVGADGNLTLTDMPEDASGDVIGMIDANNNIVITGNLADGTYIFKYENADGTYANIGSLVVGGVVQYAITANLTNCIGASGNAKVIEENGTVTLTFTANDSYVLPENVTVSGAGYTWNATTGKLVLSNPTADVVITIVATKSGYTNIIDTVGYKDNTRLSSSDGTERTGATGYVTTGMITLSPGDVLRTKGVNYTNATYNLAFAHRFNASTGAYVAAYKDSSGGVGSASDTMTNDGSGNLTIHNGSTTAFNLRLVGYGSGADLIVTINEEITD